MPGSCDLLNYTALTLKTKKYNISRGCQNEIAKNKAVLKLRYRGYYYDSETGFYYLQSRYYSPDLMRFISQDDPGLSNAQGEPIGSNLYVYCLNNPVMFKDLTGKISVQQQFALFAACGYDRKGINRLYKYKKYISNLKGSSIYVNNVTSELYNWAARVENTILTDLALKGASRVIKTGWFKWLKSAPIINGLLSPKKLSKGRYTFFVINLNKKVYYYESRILYITGPSSSWTGLFVVSSYTRKPYKYHQGLDDFMKWMVVK